MTVCSSPRSSAAAKLRRAFARREGASRPSAPGSPRPRRSRPSRAAPARRGRTPRACRRRARRGPDRAARGPLAPEVVVLGGRDALLRGGRGDVLARPMRAAPVAGRHAEADAVEPGAERGAPLEAGELAVDHEKDLLADVLDVGLTHAEAAQRPPDEGRVVREHLIEGDALGPPGEVTRPGWDAAPGALAREGRLWVQSRFTSVGGVLRRPIMKAHHGNSTPRVASSVPTTGDMRKTSSFWPEASL